jgi:hypothetical protein
MLEAVPAQPAVEKEEIAAPSFTEFWILYPRKVARKDAERAWSRLGDRAQLAAMVGIIAWREVWAYEYRMREDAYDYVPHPATWLNGERWEDEVPARFKPKPAVALAPTEPRTGRVERASPEVVKEIIAKWRNR